VEIERLETSYKARLEVAEQELALHTPKPDANRDTEPPAAPPDYYATHLSVCMKKALDLKLSQESGALWSSEPSGAAPDPVAKQLLESLRRNREQTALLHELQELLRGKDVELESLEAMEFMVRDKEACVTRLETQLAAISAANEASVEKERKASEAADKAMAQAMALANELVEVPLPLSLSRALVSPFAVTPVCDACVALSLPQLLPSFQVKRLAGEDSTRAQEQLQTSLSAMQREITANVQEREAMERNCTVLQQAVASRDTELTCVEASLAAEVHRHVSQHQDQHSRGVERLQWLEGEVDVLQGKLGAAAALGQEREQSLRNEIGIQESQVEQLQQEKAQIKQELGVLRDAEGQRKEGLVDELKEAIADRGEAAGKLQKEVKRRQELETRATTLERELKQAQQTQRAQAKVSTRKLSEAEAEVQRMQQRLGKRDKEVKMLMNESSKHEKRVAAMAKANDSTRENLLQKQLMEASERGKEATAEIRRLEQQVQDEQLNHSATAQAQQEQARQLDQELENAESEKGVLVGQLASFKRELSGAQEANQALESKLHSAIAAQGDMQNTIQEMKTELHKAKGIEKQECERMSSAVELRALRRTTELEQQLLETCNELSTERHEFSQVISTHDDTHAALKTALTRKDHEIHAERTSAQEQLSKGLKEASDLEDRLKEACDKWVTELRRQRERGGTVPAEEAAAEEANVKALRCEVDVLEAEVSRLSVQLRHNASYANAEAATHLHKENEEAKKADTMHELKKQRDDALQSLKEATESQAVILKERVDTVQAEAIRLKDAMAQATALRIKNLEATVRTLTDEAQEKEVSFLNELREREIVCVEDAKTEASTQKEQADASESELAKIRKQVEKLQSRLEETCQRLSDAELGEKKLLHQLDEASGTATTVQDLNQAAKDYEITVSELERELQQEKQQREVDKATATAVLEACEKHSEEKLNDARLNLAELRNELGERGTELTRLASEVAVKDRKIAVQERMSPEPARWGVSSSLSMLAEPSVTSNMASIILEKEEEVQNLVAVMAQKKDEMDAFLLKQLTAATSKIYLLERQLSDAREIYGTSEEALQGSVYATQLQQTTYETVNATRSETNALKQDLSAQETQLLTTGEEALRLSGELSEATEKTHELEKELLQTRSSLQLQSEEASHTVKDLNQQLDHARLEVAEAERSLIAAEREALDTVNSEQRTSMLLVEAVAARKADHYRLNLALAQQEVAEARSELHAAKFESSPSKAAGEDRERTATVAKEVADVLMSMGQSVNEQVKMLFESAHEASRLAKDGAQSPAIIRQEDEKEELWAKAAEAAAATTAASHEQALERHARKHEMRLDELRSGHKGELYDLQTSTEGHVQHLKTTHEQQVIVMQRKHEADLAASREESRHHAEAHEATRSKHADDMKTLQRDHDCTLEGTLQKHEDEKAAAASAVEIQYQDQMKALKARHDQVLNELNKEEEESQQGESDYESQVEALKAEHEVALSHLHGIYGDAQATAEAIESKYQADTAAAAEKHADIVERMHQERAAAEAIQRKNDEDMQELQKNHDEALQTMEEQHESAFYQARSIESSYEEGMQALKEEHDAALREAESKGQNVQEIDTQYQTTLQALQTQHDAALQSMKAKHEEDASMHAGDVDALQRQHKQDMLNLKDEHGTAFKEMLGKHSDAQVDADLVNRKYQEAMRVRRGEHDKVLQGMALTLQEVKQETKEIETRYEQDTQALKEKHDQAWAEMEAKHQDTQARAAEIEGEYQDQLRLAKEEHDTALEALSEKHENEKKNIAGELQSKHQEDRKALEESHNDALRGVHEQQSSTKDDARKVEEKHSADMAALAQEHQASLTTMQSTHEESARKV